MDVSEISKPVEIGKFKSIDLFIRGIGGWWYVSLIIKVKDG
jgi:hypothetical protein